MPSSTKNAQSGDVIAIFPNNEVILLVRSANGQVTIIEQGEYNTSIVKKLVAEQRTGVFFEYSGSHFV